MTAAPPAAAATNARRDTDSQPGEAAPEVTPEIESGMCFRLSMAVVTVHETGRGTMGLP